MNVKEFVAMVRQESVDGLCQTYKDMFELVDISEFSNHEMREIAAHWKESSSEVRRILQTLVRLGAQNTAASILGALDQGVGIETLASGYLLDEFWDQEEKAGHAN